MVRYVVVLVTPADIYLFGKYYGERRTLREWTGRHRIIVIPVPGAIIIRKTGNVIVDIAIKYVQQQRLRCPEQPRIALGGWRILHHGVQVLVGSRRRRCSP